MATRQATREEIVQRLGSPLFESMNIDEVARGTVRRVRSEVSGLSES